MGKKNWIFIKRGLSEDPKHRERMGMSIWLFTHMIDAADWETGRVYDWRDKEIGIDMTASTATIREWRQRLADHGYITCIQKQHSLEIIIHNWNNPKVYSSPKINIRQGKSEVAPSEKTEIEGTPQDTPQGDNQALDESRANDPSFIESSSPSLSPSQERAPLSQKDLDQCNQKVDAILENEKKAQSVWPGRDKIPEPIRELLDEFVRVSGQKPTKGKLMDWLATGQEWLEIGATAADIATAWRKAHPEKGEGFIVNRPGSLTNTINMIAGQRRINYQPEMTASEKTMYEFKQLTRSLAK